MTEKIRDDYYSIKMLSNSSLKNFLDYSPLKAWYLFKNGIKETPALINGRAIHCVVLEPEVFDNEFMVMPPDINLRTKDGRAERDALLETGKTVLKGDQYKLAINIHDAVYNSPNCAKLLEGDPEVEFFTKFGDIEFKGKVDLINYEKGYVLDLKTTLDARPEQFAKECINRYYFMQAWVYREIARRNGHDIKNFIFIAVEKEPPFSKSIIRVTDEQFEIGCAMFDEAMTRYKVALENENRDFDNRIYTVDTPAWLLKKWLGE